MKSFPWLPVLCVAVVLACVAALGFMAGESYGRMTERERWDALTDRAIAEAEASQETAEKCLAILKAR